jgi:large subunit ribosomal protein L4
MNKKEKAGAIKSALTSRVNDSKIFVMEDLDLEAIKTKQVV